MKKSVEKDWIEFSNQRESFERSISDYELLILRLNYDNLDALLSRVKNMITQPRRDIEIADRLGIPEKKLLKMVKTGKILKSSKDEFGNDAFTLEDVLKYLHASLNEIYKKYPESAPILCVRNINNS